jgi:hypothetical protein
MKLRPTCRVPKLRINAAEHRVRQWSAVRPQAVASDLDRLAGRLLARALATFNEPHHARPLRQAAKQAMELAEASGFPLLTFPELFSELAIATLLQSEYRRIGRL